jgi:hypothetical protein
MMTEQIHEPWHFIKGRGHARFLIKVHGGCFEWDNYHQDWDQDDLLMKGIFWGKFNPITKEAAMKITGGTE